MCCSEVYFTTNIFYYVRKTPSVCSGEREKRNYQEHEKVSFFSSIWVLEQPLYFIFEKMSYSLSMWLVTTVLSVPVGKRSNSLSQLFYKIDPPKNLAIFTGKHLCCRFFLVNFIKKRPRHMCFPMNIAKCLSTVFRNFMWWYNSLDVFGYKTDIFHISLWIIALFSFVTLVLE